MRIAALSSVLTRLRGSIRCAMFRQRIGRVGDRPRCATVPGHGATTWNWRPRSSAMIGMPTRTERMTSAA
jgi:hypothetical protein